MLMGSYPFAAQIVKVTKNLIVFKEKISIVTTSIFSFDIVKLLILALIKSAVVSALLRIFCVVTNFSESKLYEWGIDRIEIFKSLYTYMTLHLSKVMLTILFYIIIFSRSAGIVVVTAVSLSLIHI